MKNYNEYIKESIDWDIELKNSSVNGDLEGYKKDLKTLLDI